MGSALYLGPANNIIVYTDSMLKRLFKLVQSEATEPPYQTIPQTVHQIPQRHISQAALGVMGRLQQEGYSAFLVGGGVRDLLLGAKPKDFDIATSATPEQVKALFRRARIIGRRFRIVHVHLGRETIEVTTFRAHHNDADNKTQAAQSDKGILLRDNVYGDIKSDALRRDFTVNALYYDGDSEEIYDFTQGAQDIEQRVVRIIGKAENRYREDPVRMLRAIRFAAKLGFSIEAQTAAPIATMSSYLSHVPPARMFEEVLKMFMSGSATASLPLLCHYDLFKHFFPGANDSLVKQDPIGSKLISQALQNTDQRIRQNKRVTPAFLYAALLWPPLQTAIQNLQSTQKISLYEALQRSAPEVISQQLVHTSIPRRFLTAIREIWVLQIRLTKRDGKRAPALLEHPRFRAAYDFLLLREEAGEDLGGLGLWWTQFQEAKPEKQQALIRELDQKRPRRQRSRKSKSANTPKS